MKVVQYENHHHRVYQKHPKKLQKETVNEIQGDAKSSVTTIKSAVTTIKPAVTTTKSGVTTKTTSLTSPKSPTQPIIVDELQQKQFNQAPNSMHTLL